jgi:hypothetical protein
VSFNAVRAQVTSSNFALFGFPVLVTRPQQAGVETCAIWLTPTTDDFPIGAEFQRRTSKRSLALQRTSEIETVPRGTVVRAAGACGEPEQDWQVDGIDIVEAEHIRVWVVPIADDAEDV